MKLDIDIKMEPIFDLYLTSFKPDNVSQEDFDQEMELIKTHIVDTFEKDFIEWFVPHFPKLIENMKKIKPLSVHEFSLKCNGGT